MDVAGNDAFGTSETKEEREVSKLLPSVQTF